MNGNINSASALGAPDGNQQSADGHCCGAVHFVNGMTEMDDLPEELTHFITRRFVYFFAGQQIGDEIDVGVERSSRGLIDLRMTGASARYSQRLRIILRPLEKENEGNLATQVVPSD